MCPEVSIGSGGSDEDFFGDEGIGIVDDDVGFARAGV